MDDKIVDLLRSRSYQRRMLVITMAIAVVSVVGICIVGPLSSDDADSDLGVILEDKYFEYQINDGVASITLCVYSGSVRDFVIPATVTYDGVEYDVVSIGNSAFNNCNKIRSVTMGDNIRSIGTYAFSNCENLTSVTIGDNVLTLSHHTFSGCTYLKTVTLGYRLVSIEDDAFYGCKKIETVYNRSLIDLLSLKDDGDLMNYNPAVYGAPVVVRFDPFFISYNPTSYVYEISSYFGSDPVLDLPSSITLGGKEYTLISIAAYALEFTKHLTSVTIPESVWYIGKFAFRGCYSLVEVCNESPLDIVVGSSTHGSVAYNAKNVYTSDSGDSILYFYGGNAYMRYDGADYLVTYMGGTGDVELPSQVYDGERKVESYALYKHLFYSDRNLTSVVIPDIVSSIGDCAFDNCSSLVSVTLPDGITSIGYSTFNACLSLASLTIPDSVTSIGEYAFYDCKSLTFLTIPDNVTSISKYAFTSCSSLVSVTLGESLEGIGENAFRGCVSLVEVCNKSSLTFTEPRDHGYVKFYALNLYSPDSGESMLFTHGDYVFMRYNGGYLLVKYFGVGHHAILPSEFNDGDVVVSSYGIHKSAFLSIDRLEEVTIPCNVTVIGEKAFFRCDNLHTVNNESLIEIIKGDSGNGHVGYYAETVNGYTLTETVGDFDVTYNPLGKCCMINGYMGSQADLHISSFIIDGETYVVKRIGDSAFYECVSLVSLTLDEGLISIEGNAFIGCHSLVEVCNLSKLDIVAGSTDHGHVAYYAKNVYSSDSGSSILYTYDDYILMLYGERCHLVKYVGNGKYLTLPTELNHGDRRVLSYTIYPYAFHGNEIVLEVTIPYSVTSIGDNAFEGCTSLNTVRNLSLLDIKCGDTGNGYVAYYADTVEGTVKSATVDHYDVRYNDLSRVYGIYGYSGSESKLNLGNLTIDGTLYTLTEIGKSAFEGCTSLVSVTLAFSVIFIDDDAFKGCHSLVEVCNRSYLELTPGFEEHGYVAYYAKNIYIPGKNNTILFPYHDYIFMRYDGGCYLVKYIGEGGDITLPSQPRYNDEVFTSYHIYPYAFHGFKNPISVTVPSDKTFIDDYAFHGCVGLESVIFPKDLTLIGEHAFSGCTGLTEILFTWNSKIILGDMAFYGIGPDVLLSSPFEGHALKVFSDPGMTQLVTAEELSNGDIHSLYLEWVPGPYKITWKNWDGEVLLVDDMAYNTLPEYTGAVPTRGPTVQHTYKFIGWGPTIVPVTSDVTYTALFEEAPRNYVVTWKDWDGTVLRTDVTVPYGAIPEYDGPEPTRSSTAKYDYAFSGWSPAPDTIEGDTVYTAVYTEKLRDYTITWQNWNGNVLRTDVFPYGSIPEYSGDDPVREGQPGHTYVFIGWTPEITEVTRDLTYTAEFNDVLDVYEILFLNHDGTVLHTVGVHYGVKPVYAGEVPTKDPTVQHTYKFAGWDPEIVPAVGDATYTAKFIEVTRTYLISFENDNGTVLQSGNLEYGKTPVYNGEVPTKDATVQYTYTFNGWSPEVVEVTGPATYVATYASAINKYTIDFIDWNNNVLQSQDVAYGDIPVYVGDTPVRDATAQYLYTFNGWSPEPSAVTGHATYMATYTEELRKYVITWKNDDGSVIDTTELEYGKVPTHADASKPSTTMYAYTFNGWSPEVVEVTGPATYTATYTEELRKYVITWKNDDGSVIDTTELEYGKVPTHADASKAATQKHVYIFNGWSPEVVEVTGPATYTATYTEEPRKYVITWRNDDGHVIDTTKVEYGKVPTHADASKSSSPMYAYTFKGWSPEVVEVTGPATYTASYTPTVREYDITFVNWDNSLLQEKSVRYGDVPEYTGMVPTKNGDESKAFVFAGWDPVLLPVVGIAVYKAIFVEVANEYTVTFVNWDGKILQKSMVPYGQTPVYSGEAPTRGATVQHTYTFEGWSPQIGAVLGPATYTASFTMAVNEYTVTFVNWNDDVLQSGKVAYDMLPIYVGEIPTRENDQSKSYVFTGWDPIVVSVTGDAIYKATFFEVITLYPITFVDWDGTILQESECAYGTTPIYFGDTPTRGATAQYTYKFDGWSPKVSEVNGPATYVATYVATVNEYTVTFVNWDGTILQESTFPYGQTPVYSGEPPTRGATAQYTYKFVGWSPEVSEVVGPATYVATYVATVKQYTVTFVNWDGVVLQQSMFPYGDEPKFRGTIPTKDPSAQYTYTFDGWSPEVVAVTGDATYKATFTSIVNVYAISWLDSDGSLIDITHVAYGEVPVHADVSKPATAQYTYTFDGWSPKISEVVGPAVYTARYIATVNEYTVTFVNWNDDVLQSGKVAYGKVPVYDGDTPVREATLQYTYRFSGWDSDPSPVNGDVTYKAEFLSTLIWYNVTFLDDDGTVLLTRDFPYGIFLSYGRDPPTKDADMQYTYEFAGWSPSIRRVTQDAVYTATYSKTVNTYDVTFVDWDGTVLQSSKVPYGETPVYNGSVPTRDPTVQYIYTFDGWSPEISDVTSNIVYTAVYVSELREYTVSFLVGDDVFKSRDMGYGIPIFAPVEIPSLPDSYGYKFTFICWEGFEEGMTVTRDMSFLAIFLPEPRSYPEVVDKEVVFDIGEDELFLGEAMIDETHYRFEAGEIDNVSVRMNNGSISFDKDAFFVFRSESVHMTMERISDSAVPKWVSHVTHGCPVFDISVGNHHNFGSGKLTLSIEFEMHDDMVKSSLKVLHFGSDGGYETVDFVYEDGKVIFETSSLSYFAIVYDTIPDGNTVDNRIISIVIALMFVVGAIGFVFARRF